MPRVASATDGRTPSLSDRMASWETSLAIRTGITLLSPMPTFWITKRRLVEISSLTNRTFQRAALT